MQCYCNYYKILWLLYLYYFFFLFDLLWRYFCTIPSLESSSRNCVGMLQLRSDIRFLITMPISILVRHYWAFCRYVFFFLLGLLLGLSSYFIPRIKIQATWVVAAEIELTVSYYQENINPKAPPQD